MVYLSIIFPLYSYWVEFIKFIKNEILINFNSILSCIKCFEEEKMPGIKKSHGTSPSKIIQQSGKEKIHSSPSVAKKVETKKPKISDKFNGWTFGDLKRHQNKDDVDEYMSELFGVYAVDLTYFDKTVVPYILHRSDEHKNADEMNQALKKFWNELNEDSICDESKINQILEWVDKQTPFGIEIKETNGELSEDAQNALLVYLYSTMRVPGFEDYASIGALINTEDDSSLSTLSIEKQSQRAVQSIFVGNPKTKADKAKKNKKCESVKHQLETFETMPWNEKFKMIHDKFALTFSFDTSLGVKSLQPIITHDDDETFLMVYGGKLQPLAKEEEKKLDESKGGLAKKDGKKLDESNNFIDTLNNTAFKVVQDKNGKLILVVTTTAENITKDETLSLLYGANRQLQDEYINCHCKHGGNRPKKLNGLTLAGQQHRLKDGKKSNTNKKPAGINKKPAGIDKKSATKKHSRVVLSKLLTNVNPSQLLVSGFSGVGSGPFSGAPRELETTSIDPSIMEILSRQPKNGRGAPKKHKPPQKMVSSFQFSGISQRLVKLSARKSFDKQFDILNEGDKEDYKKAFKDMFNFDDQKIIEIDLSIEDIIQVVTNVLAKQHENGRKAKIQEYKKLFQNIDSYKLDTGYKNKDFIHMVKTKGGIVAVEFFIKNLEQVKALKLDIRPFFQALCPTPNLSYILDVNNRQNIQQLFDKGFTQKDIARGASITGFNKLLVHLFEKTGDHSNFELLLDKFGLDHMRKLFFCGYIGVGHESLMFLLEKVGWSINTGSHN